LPFSLLGREGLQLQTEDSLELVPPQSYVPPPLRWPEFEREGLQLKTDDSLDVPPPLPFSSLGREEMPLEREKLQLKTEDSLELVPPPLRSPQFFLLIQIVEEQPAHN